MSGKSSVLLDKVQRSRGEVHRPSDDAEPSSPLSTDSQDTPRFDGSSDPSQTLNLPPYSGPSGSSTQPTSPSGIAKGPQYYPGLPILDYRQYSPPLFELSADMTTITSNATYLSQNAKALSTLLQQLATVPPKPQITVTGNRSGRIDFDLKMNLMNLLIPDDPSQRMDYLRVINKDEMGLRGGQKPALRPEIGDGGFEGWCKRFVDDPADIKYFTMERVVANLDTNWLEGQLRSLVASTKYEGVVTVSFPVTHSRIVIQSPDKVNKFFTSVSALFSGKSKYEVIKAVWPFATTKNGEPNRRCIVQSEKTWWEEWKDPIKYAIATKRHGWVTNEDKLECIMESKAKGFSIVDW